MTNYNDLTTSQKRLVTTNLNIKHKLVELQAKLDADKEDIFALVEEVGTIKKGGDKIVYVAQGKDKIVFDVDKFAIENPLLYAKYLKPKTGNSATVKYTLSR